MHYGEYIPDTMEGIVRLSFALAAASAFTLFINSGTFLALSSGHATLAHTGVRPGSIDEAHTFALMREVAEGHLALGSASLRDHRDDAGLMYGVVPQGLLLRVTGWKIPTVVWIGDLLFPFLAVLLLTLALAPLFSGGAAAAVGLIGANALGTRWLRSINPQVSFPLLALFLLLFLHPRRTPLRALLRGCIAAILLFAHIHYSLYVLLLEGCDLVRRMMVRMEERRSIGLECVAFLLPFGIAVLGKIIAVLGTDPGVIADTQRRLGFIPSHLPAAPLFQFGVVVLLAFLLFAHSRAPRAGGERDALARLALVLVAGCLALSQSLLHGRDAIFGVYYRPILEVAGVIALCTAVSFLLSPRVRNVVLGFLLLGSIARTGGEVRDLMREQRAQAFPASESLQVIAWLQRQPGELTIAAPLDIADLIPVFTSHYTLFNRYSRFGSATDEELAERFLLLQGLIPETAEEIDTSYGLVLGQYAGNVAARKRSLCTIRALLSGAEEACVADVRGSIYHQDVLRLLEKATVDRPASLRKFHVDIAIVPGTIPDDLRGTCSIAAILEGFTVAQCAHDQEEAAMSALFRTII